MLLDIECHLTIRQRQHRSVLWHAFRWGLNKGDQTYGDPVYIISFVQNDKILASLIQVQYAQN